MTQPHETNCIFCNIVARRAPAAVFYEDEQIVGFLDAFPAAEGHSLIVPKPHYADIFPLPTEYLQAVVLFSQRLARAQMQAFDADGIGIAQFNRAAAGQTVFHYHMHVVPRHVGASPNFHGRQRADMETLQATAARIRAALQVS
jgi:histidine triad (HIT) family protein